MTCPVLRQNRTTPDAAVVREAVALRRLWKDRADTSDDAYGAAAETFWQKIDALGGAGG